MDTIYKTGLKVVYAWVPLEIHKQLKESAKNNKMDISKLIRVLISQHLYRENNE